MTLTYQYPVLIPQGIYVQVPCRVIPATQTLTDTKQFQSLWKQAEAYNDYYAYIKQVRQTDGESTHTILLVNSPFLIFVRYIQDWLGINRHLGVYVLRRTNLKARKD